MRFTKHSKVRKETIHRKPLEAFYAYWDCGNSDMCIDRKFDEWVADKAISKRLQRSFYNES